MSDLREALEEAIVQINYLHERLGYKTGSGNSTLAKLRAALSAQPQPEAVEVDQIQRAMDMLGDVPGNTILERVERIVSYYLALQCELEKVRAVPPLAPDERMRRALERIASFNDTRANNVLAMTGSYGSFDEPTAVKIAREALSGAADASNASAEARLPGMDWELSDDAKSRIAEIDRCIVRPGDPRLNQIIGGTAFCGHGVMASICDKCADDGKESEGEVCRDCGHGKRPLDGALCQNCYEKYWQRRNTVTPAPSDPTPPDQYDVLGNPLGHVDTPRPPDATAQREAIARMLLEFDGHRTWELNGQAEAVYLKRADRIILALSTRAGG